MIKRTFTFDQQDEKQFNSILSRLDPEDYTIVEPMTWEKPETPRESDRKIVMEIDDQAAMTFRLGMGNGIKIRRERTEEELAEEKALDDANTVKITVKVDGLQPPTP